MFLREATWIAPWAHLNDIVSTGSLLEAPDILITALEISLKIRRALWALTEQAREATGGCRLRPQLDSLLMAHPGKSSFKWACRLEYSNAFLWYQFLSPKAAEQPLDTGWNGVEESGSRSELICSKSVDTKPPNSFLQQGNTAVEPVSRLLCTKHYRDYCVMSGTCGGKPVNSTSGSSRCVIPEK